jgi:nucleoside 2-deoxyribosyltransferase
MIKIYLCGSISNAQVNSMVSRMLSSGGCEVFDPCTITPEDMSKTHFSYSVYAQCKRAIEACDILFVFLDSYGKDSAWEVGFARGLGKCIVGVVAAASLFLEDWMVKYAFDKILVVDKSWLAPEITSPDWATVQQNCEVCTLEEIPSRLSHLMGLTAPGGAGVGHRR